ncbi:hypothetical protein IWQ60_010503 [Tieghemiomyces parasiticus]|uniref:Enoyl reductase (ER) domain-containing protein n=1 Tax=Tieghemiomyces parasiticus TaxID=78921 RepID=A0A9W8DJJ6_9FUNG|nr:hypothetical protein IWQ60_010503 [Tieghemiomyces parasiticus]
MAPAATTRSSTAAGKRPAGPPRLLTAPARVQISKYADGEALCARNFTITPITVGPDEVPLHQGEVLVQPVYISVDTNLYFRVDGIWEHKFQLPLLPLGEVVRGFGVGFVLCSKHPDYQSGDRVMGWDLPWASYGAVAGGHALISLRDQLSSIPTQWFMGVLSMHSFSAWYGLTQVAHAQPGENILISVATGGIGQMAVQLAGIMGLRVVAVVGSNRKVHILRDNPYVAEVFNFFAVSEQVEVLRRLFPQGIDIYFDCVGGAFLDAVLTHLRPHGRVILGGLMSDNGLVRHPSRGVRAIPLLSATSSSITGFMVQDIYQQYYATFVEDLRRLIAQGKIFYRIDLVCGIENGPQAVEGVMASRNLGKCIIQVSEDPTFVRVKADETVSPSRKG